MLRGFRRDRRKAIFAADGKLIDTPVYDGSKLGADPGGAVIGRRTSIRPVLFGLKDLIRKL